MVEFGSLMETRLPYLDNDLVDVLLAIPPGVEARRPDPVAHPPPPEAGVPRRRQREHRGAGRRGAGWSGRSPRRRLKVLAKLGVRGYQPYERLGALAARGIAPPRRAASC